MALYDYFIVDAFASEPFTGNPAAVVLEASHLADQQMQAIAREFNLSETVFVLPSTHPKAAVRLRIFSPATESILSGHGMLAAVTALIRSGRFVMLLDHPETLLPIETPNGLYSACCERLRRDSDEFLVWVELEPPGLKPFRHDPSKTATLLGIDPLAIDSSLPAMQTQDGDVILFVKTFTALNEARPEFAALGEFSRRRSVRVWCIATQDTLTASVNAHSRCFAPSVGVNEDTVTGMVHGPLGAYLVVNEQVPMAGDTAALSCTQSDSTARAGLVRVLVARQPPAGYSVRIAGQCFVSMQGQIHIPS
jgi:PhzF family phenazine biosynthesis protein